MSAGRGIVRTARRPAGWIAPGPAPRARDDVAPGPGEDLCFLSGEWRILQRVDGHRWSLDDLVTAWLAARVAASSPPRRLLDLGCGIGSVLLMLAWRFPDAIAVGVEAQAVSVDLARRSIAWNGCGDRCTVREGDLRDPQLVPEGIFDLVTGTPPYLPIGTARESRRVQKGPCNFEHRGGIEAYATAAASALAPGGAAVVCEQASQDPRVHAAAAGAGLGVACTLPVVPRAGKAPLFSVHEMRRREETRSHEMLAPLVVRDTRGARTPAFRALRGEMGLPP
ncbi:MAG TPA: methyltransferase domain-containing protein [Candidatus Eisenbacteria bacterium]|nr:methyltransferase domain-containing protein [Candidatus Eisenbacteria bacterium]